MSERFDFDVNGFDEHTDTFEDVTNSDETMRTNKNMQTNETDNQSYSYQQPQGNAGQRYNYNYNPYQQSQDRYHQAYQYQQQPGSGQGYSYQQPPKPRRKKTEKAKKSGTSRFWVKAVCGGLVFGLISGVVFEGVHLAGNALFGQSSSANPAAVSTASMPDDVQVVKVSSDNVETIEATDVSDIVKEAMPCVVSVNTVVVTQMQDFFGRTYSQEGQDAGTGFIFSEDENYVYIATNNHVIDGASTISVTFDDDSSADAVVKGTNPDADVAVIQIERKNLSEDTRNHIKVAVLGDSDAIQPGNGAIAIGNALGYGQSVTTGAISAVNRKVQLTDGEMMLIQTSAAINPGNSGGPLLNTKGEVIGINTIKYAETKVEGMGFAIPINSALETINDILSGRETVKSDEDAACFGIKGGTITDSMAAQSGYPVGVYVSYVFEGSAAYTAGIEAGDVIVGFDGQPITSIEELQDALQNYHPGDRVTVDVCEFQADGTYGDPQTWMTVLGSKADIPE